MLRRWYGVLPGPTPVKIVLAVVIVAVAVVVLGVAFEYLGRFLDSGGAIS